MLTRKAATRICKCEGQYEFKSSDSLPKGILPTKRDVLQRLLHEKNWRTRPAATTVATELVELWTLCNVYSISVDGVVSRIQKLVKDFRKIDYQPKQIKKGATLFQKNVKDLFDIFCSDQKQRRKVEEHHKLRMNAKDFAFYKDQKGARIGKCLNMIENWISLM